MLGSFIFNDRLHVFGSFSHFTKFLVEYECRIGITIIPTLVSVSSTFYAHIFLYKILAPKITKPNVSREKLPKSSKRTKEALMKQWWNWHLECGTKPGYFWKRSHNGRWNIEKYFLSNTKCKTYVYYTWSHVYRWGFLCCRINVIKKKKQFFFWKQIILDNGKLLISYL